MTVELTVVHRLNVGLKGSLSSLFRTIGKLDVYHRQLLPAFHPGPALVVAARAKAIPNRLPRRRFQALMFCYAQTGMYAVMSPIYTTSIDVQLSMAVFKAVVEHVGKFGFHVRYVVRDQAWPIVEALTSAGFQLSKFRTAQDRTRYLILDVSPSALLKALQRERSKEVAFELSVDTSQPRQNACRLLTLLQKHSLYEPADIIMPP